MMPQEKTAPAPVTQDQFQNQLRYYDDQMQKMKTKIRLLVRILVDKKIIGEEIAKTFEETNETNKSPLKPVTDELLQWYIDRHLKP